MSACTVREWFNPNIYICVLGRVLKSWNDAGAGARPLISHLGSLQCILTVQQKCIYSILIFVNQQYLYSLKMIHCCTKILWKQNHTSDVPQIRGVNPYFQLEFIAWWYSQRGPKEAFKTRLQFKACSVLMKKLFCWQGSYLIDASSSALLCVNQTVLVEGFENVRWSLWAEAESFTRLTDVPCLCTWQHVCPFLAISIDLILPTNPASFYPCPGVNGVHLCVLFTSKTKTNLNKNEWNS